MRPPRTTSSGSMTAQTVAIARPMRWAAFSITSVAAASPPRAASKTSRAESAVPPASR